MLAIEKETSGDLIAFRRRRLADLRCQDIGRPPKENHLDGRFSHAGCDRSDRPAVGLCHCLTCGIWILSQYFRLDTVRAHSRDWYVMTGGGVSSKVRCEVYRFPRTINEHLCFFR